MNSLKKYTIDITDEEYHDNPAWCYSTISRYAKEGFQAIATLHDSKPTTPSMEFGSLFDSIITKGINETKKEYVIDDTSVPPAEKTVFDTLLSKGYKVDFQEIPTSDLINVMEECSFYPKYKTDTRLKKLYDASAYYDKRRTGKKIVSRNDLEDAFEMAKALYDNEYCKSLFGHKNTESIEYLYQLKFITDYTLPSGRTVTMKIMPDLIILNHEDKTIQLVDLKTSSVPAHMFKDNFIKFRYDLQASIYSDVISHIISNDKVLKNYTILPYLFTDISRTDKVPVTHLYDQTDISQSEGFSYTSGDKTYTYKRWDALLDEIIDYETTNAKVPSYINLDGPNDILTLLNK